MHPWTLYKRGLMSFWYWYVRKLNALWPTITVDGRRLTVRPGVYKPLENEQACVAYCNPGDRVLDLGCGSGISAIFCADKAREVVAVDISPAAVETTKDNCRAHGIDNVHVAESDMFSNVEGRFNLILANPPYIAADFKDAEEQFATSVRYLPILFAEVHEHLEPGGRLLVQYPMWFKGSIKRLASRHGLTVTKIERMPAKSLKLALLSLVYLQVGFRSTLYLIEQPGGATADTRGPAMTSTETSKAA